MLSITFVALGLVAGRADAQVAGDPREMMVEIREPVGMSATVYLFAGSCGRDRFEVEMRGSDRPNEGSWLSLRFNGNAVVATEMNKILALVPPDYYIYEPVVAECLKGARQARVRLLIAGSPSPTPRWLSLLVGADGRVTGFKEEKRAEIPGAEGLSETTPSRVMTVKRHQASPTDILYSVAGSCGRDRYALELRRSDRSAEGATLSLQVNGHRVDPTEMERIEAAVPEGFAFDRAVVRECLREVRQARTMLMLGGKASPELRWLSFLVGAEGRVTGIKNE